MSEYTIIFFWDDEASVWIAESEDLPGLILESDSFDNLVEKVKKAVHDLLELNETNHRQVKLHFKAERLAVVA
jgi:predicted RNase H-like HicB family nuclease